MPSPRRTREEIIAEMQAAASHREGFEVMLPILQANLQAAKANLALAESEDPRDDAWVEDWRLTVHLHKCAVAFNQANQQVIARTLVRGREELDALNS